jgi:UDP-glucose 4-epimerase
MMKTILITGVSGFIGRALAQSLAQSYRVIGFSRKAVDIPGVTTIGGDFAEPTELSKLDDHAIDVLIHLAAVTGGCSEEDGLRVNVAGTHHLLRYLIERGCRKFVLASSIAVVGLQSISFRPLHLPMADEHPCLDRDGYGFSKYLMEEVTRYLARQNGALDFINLRLASIVPDEQPVTLVRAGELRPWAIAGITKMYLSDTVRCLTLAADAPPKPGVRILNAVGTQAAVAEPVPVILRAWYGADAAGLDLAHYEQPGHEYDALFATDRIIEELGFVPRQSIAASR